MVEIEKCVCGGEARFDGEWVSCYECGREGEVFTFGEPDARAKAIASWNHDQRGLRLLREVYPFMHGNNYMPCGEDGRCWLIPERIWEEIREWNLKAKEGDRE